MSVDTYLKGKNLTVYQTVAQEDVVIHISPSLLQWAQAATVDTVSRLGRKSFAVRAEHRHQPT